ncbi:MAG: hypothetical protein HFH68_06985 [Lachnospiraceae bacterium]|nr:hypothetical protein [Lachnospiraceae bacterium]
MSNNEQELEFLYEAYKHYKATGDKHYKTRPYNADYLRKVFNACTYLQKQGYIENVSDNLLKKHNVNLEDFISFDITSNGIEIARSNR